MFLWFDKRQEEMAKFKETFGVENGDGHHQLLQPGEEVGGWRAQCQNQWQDVERTVLQGQISSTSSGGGLFQPGTYFYIYLSRKNIIFLSAEEGQHQRTVG